MAAIVADLVPDDAAELAGRFEIVASMTGSAAAANPSSAVHRNTVRAAWIVAAIALVVGGAVALTELVTEIVQQVWGPCGNVLCLFGAS